MVTTRPPSLGRLRAILVGVDDAALDERVLRFAIALALRHDADLSIVTAIDRGGVIANACADGTGYARGAAALEERVASVTATLETAARRAGAAGVAATTALLDGRAAPAMVARAIEARADAIVVGTRATHGLGRFFMGSTADGVIRHANVPTFVVPPVWDRPTPFARIVVALDESDASESASDFALGLAAIERGVVCYCNVVETRDLFAKAAAYGYDASNILRSVSVEAAKLLAMRLGTARERSLAAEGKIVVGEAATELIAEAERRDADVIVVGIHGRRGLHRLELGSVAETIVSRSAVPVLVVRPATPGEPKFERRRHERSPKPVERGVFGGSPLRSL